MSNIRKHGIILSGIVLLVCIASFFAFYKENKEEEEILSKKSVIAYLMHEQLLVEVEYETYESDVIKNIEEIMHSMMQSKSGFTSLLKEESILEKVEVKEKEAILYFDVFSYEEKNERTLLESMIYACTQFENIDSIKIIVNGEELKEMPLGKLTLKNTSRSFGINSVDSNQLYLHEGNSFVLYYKTKINKKEYFVPRSVRLLHEDDYKEIIDVLVNVSNVSSSLTQPLAKHHVISLKDPYFEDGVLNLYFNNAILEDKTSLNEECSIFLKKIFESDLAIRMIQVHVKENVYDINIRN